jgi:hypothetical protein
MPFAFLLHFAIAIFFAVHAVRTNQGLYWVFILLMFPLVGSLVYMLAIWLPEMRHSRRVRQAGTKVREILDPGRELREARAAHAEAPSVRNHMRLADALMAERRPEEALTHYEAALTGLYASDPELRTRKARALLEAGRAADAKAELDALIAEKPEFRSAAGHLTYARAVAALGDRDKAHEEFGVLVDYFPGMEARARYATLLREWGESERARTLAAESLKIAQRLPGHSRTADREWIAALQKIDKR